MPASNRRLAPVSSRQSNSWTSRVLLHLVPISTLMLKSTAAWATRGHPAPTTWWEDALVVATILGTVPLMAIHFIVALVAQVKLIRKNPFKTKVPGIILTILSFLSPLILAPPALYFMIYTSGSERLTAIVVFALLLVPGLASIPLGKASKRKALSN